MVRFAVLLLFCLSLAFAAYLGFSLISLGHDKAIHFVTFFILTSEFYFLWDTYRPWKITVVAMTFGASIALEYVQNFVNPNRKFDYMDIIYNIHGSALAVATCCIIHSYTIRRRAQTSLPQTLPSDEPSDIDDFVNVRMNDLDNFRD